jgi:hypothetical protein
LLVRRCGLEVNAKETKYMVLPRDRSGGKNHKIQIDKSFEREEQLKYLGTILRNDNSFQEEIKID